MTDLEPRWTSLFRFSWKLSCFPYVLHSPSLSLSLCFPTADSLDGEEYLDISGIMRNQAGRYECKASNDVATPDVKYVNVVVNCRSIFFGGGDSCFSWPYVFYNAQLFLLHWDPWYVFHELMIGFMQRGNKYNQDELLWLDPQILPPSRMPRALKPRWAVWGFFGVRRSQCPNQSLSGTEMTRGKHCDVVESQISHLVHILSS